MSALNKIINIARSDTKRIVLPESSDPRILKAAVELTEEGIAKTILVGNPDLIHDQAKSLSLTIDGLEIIDPENTDKSNSYQSKLYSIRKQKGMTEAQAAEALLNPLIFACIMVAMRDADGCVAGAVNTSSGVVRAALQIIGMKSDSKLVSSFFIMEHNLDHQAINGTMIYADCALVIDPSADELANIAINSTDSARSLLNIDPVVALLSFSTAGSANHPYVEKVKEAGKIIAATRPDIALMTEVQFDAAILPNVLQQKAPDIAVKAPANVFIFPDLQSANIGYKIAQRIGGVEAIGPILQGLKHPVNDLSRGCSVDDIVKLVSVTAVQCA